MAAAASDYLTRDKISPTWDLLGVAIIAAIVSCNPPPERTQLFPPSSRFHFSSGVMMIIPIGGADMPTVISLLNSYAGPFCRQWASSSTANWLSSPAHLTELGIHPFQ